MRDPLYPYTFVNKSGETVPGFSVMQLHTSGSATVNNRVFTGITKPDGAGFGYLVNGPVAVANNEYGHAACPVMPVWVKYSGNPPSQGGFCGPADGLWTVTDDGSDFIVWHRDTTNSLVFAQMHSILPSIVGKTDSAATAGSTVSVSIYTKIFGTPADTGVNKTCEALVDIDSGLWVSVTPLHGDFFCAPLECNA